MEWSDRAILLAVRRHGESSVIAEVLTADHGRHLGLVRGGHRSASSALLQAGNSLMAHWQARLEEQLGVFRLESMTSRTAAIISSGWAGYVMQLLAAHLRLLPERDPHPRLFTRLEALLDLLEDPHALAAGLVRFEIDLLTEFGFGLDLTECAATGRRDTLVWVSPRSGRAVCAAAGQPYASRLFALPAFLTQPSSSVSHDELLQGFRLSGYFLQRHLYDPRGLTLPDVRAAFIHTLKPFEIRALAV